MSSEIIRNQTPEERELERKKAELASLEADLVQRELGLATLRAELRAFEARYISTVGILYADLDEIEAKIAEAQARLSPKDNPNITLGSTLGWPVSGQNKQPN